MSPEARHSTSLAPMHWPRIVLRSTLTWIVGVLATVVGAISALILAMINPSSPAIEKVIQWWSKAWLTASGTELTIEGRENVDKGRSYIVVANHLSTLDIMVCFVAVGIPIRYLAKKELFRIPLLAQAMRAIGIVEVDRAARSSVHNSVNQQAEKLIEHNQSLIIYAEGTRPRDGAMKPFKKGAFTIAITSGLPVLPVSIHGTYEAAVPGKPWFRGGPVTVIIDPAIPTDGMTRSDADALRDQTREIIAKRVTDLGGQVS